MVRVCPTLFTLDDYKKNETLNKYFNQYPFELDHFQKYAIQGIIEEKNVLITAHTGSGKTLPSEFCIDYFYKKGKKTIYTSPIKSLSNQKFNEFQKKFPHISFGIITGDIKFNPSADVLIMTTEILRNTLFHKTAIQNGNIEAKNIQLHFDFDFQTEVGCVVFDEIHYINDTQRGKVWEETLMILPNHIQILMLSATIDKQELFAEWIENLKYRECWIASTNIRIVPLTHYAFPTIPYSNEKTLLNAKNGNNLLYSFKKHNVKPVVFKEGNKIVEMNKFNEIKILNDYVWKNQIAIHPSFALNEIVNYCWLNKLVPAICFVFSRQKCLQYAQMIQTTLFEEGAIEPNIVEKEVLYHLRKFQNYKEYIQLPEYEMMISLLKKGIAIHHSGVLPIFREIIEIIFDKGFIKLLFATETFAVGINLPTKSVIMTDIKKYSDGGFRYLHPHEYTQIAGRAGRRGLDEKGYVFHLTNLYELPPYHIMKNILNGKPQELISKFEIDFRTILRLVEADGLNVANYVKKSRIDEVIQSERNQIIEHIEMLKKKIDESKNDAIQYINSDDKLKLIEFTEKIEKSSLSANRKKKLNREFEKFMEKIGLKQEQYNEWKYKKHIEKEIEKREEELMELNNHVENKIGEIIRFFINAKAIQQIPNDNNQTIKHYILTQQGEIANCIQELPLLTTSDWINNKKYENLETIELIQLFSCFTNIKNRDTQICGDDYENYQFINEYIDMIEIEKKLYLDFRLQVPNDLEYHFELVDLIKEWCMAKNEKECEIVMKKLYDRGIFMGEFHKAVLKIITIQEEMVNIGECFGFLLLIDKLKNVGDLLLKSFIVNQSLYIS